MANLAGVAFGFPFEPAKMIEPTNMGHWKKTDLRAGARAGPGQCPCLSPSI